MIGSVSFYPVSPVAPAREGPAATPQGTAPPPAWATISRPGEVLSKLQDLAASDPARLQAALTHVSQDLQAGAQGTTGSKAEALSDLAGRFAKAATAGDLSALGTSSVHRHHRAQPSSADVPGADAEPTGSPSAAGGASSASESAAQAMLPDVLEQMDVAMGMNPPPFGPWFTPD
jgi:hypothetical protein